MASMNFWKLNICVWLSALMLLATPLWAASPDIYSFSSPQEGQRFEALTKELRCLVCQNQSLADSDAPLAKDLRNKIFLMVNEHQSDQEIKQFLVSRYGEFILFSPPFKGGTAVLWAFPGLLLLFIFGFLFFKKRKIDPSMA